MSTGVRVEAVRLETSTMIHVMEHPLLWMIGFLLIFAAGLYAILHVRKQYRTDQEPEPMRSPVQDGKPASPAADSGQPPRSSTSSTRERSTSSVTPVSRSSQESDRLLEAAMLQATLLPTYSNTNDTDRNQPASDTHRHHSSNHQHSSYDSSTHHHHSSSSADSSSSSDSSSGSWGGSDSSGSSSSDSGSSGGSDW